MKVQRIFERPTSGWRRFPPPASPPNIQQIWAAKRIKVHRRVPKWRALHLIGFNRLWTALHSSFGVLHLYWLFGDHNSSFLFSPVRRFPALASGGTERAWCTTVSIAAEIESWLENSRGLGVKLGLRLCLLGRLSHLSRTGIPRVLPSPLLLATMSRPPPSAQSSFLMLAGSGSSKGCFRGRPGRLLMTLFPVLACRCRRFARRIFCTWLKFKECIFFTSFWICSTSRRLYLLLLETPARGEANQWRWISHSKQIPKQSL